MKSFTIALLFLLGLLGLTCAAPSKDKAQDAGEVVASDQNGFAIQRRQSTHTYILCEGQNGVLGCPGNKRLRILYANYGRTSRNVCWHLLFMSNTNCHSSYAKRKIRGACNGHNSCRLYATNNSFGDPCPWTHKYIEVHYKCV
ncbi:L-rhamnose-binding lectin ELEL-1-like [Actinia tenebrosa]|uniref:L-rhamnose-binding lectin ELEL-1-like n=1 Tax=Actinia tenebrosa TaxID=6105 RepID=A0A6P8HLZ5_ACTTE|nr:L-rhamnose-binding lectin ELEL-1-like [Actinia tenebrosa]